MSLPSTQRENDSSCPEHRHSITDHAAKALGRRRNGKLHRCAFDAGHRSGHRIVRARFSEKGRSSAEIAGNGKIPASSGAVPVAAGWRHASAESCRVTELHLWVARRPLIREVTANPLAGNAEIPASSAGVPAVAGRPYASAESRLVTELHLWVVRRPLIGKARAKPPARIGLIPIGP